MCRYYVKQFVILFNMKRIGKAFGLRFAPASASGSRCCLPAAATTAIATPISEVYRPSASLPACGFIRCGVSSRWLPLASRGRQPPRPSGLLRLPPLERSGQPGNSRRFRAYGPSSYLLRASRSLLFSYAARWAGGQTPRRSGPALRAPRPGWGRSAYASSFLLRSRPPRPPSCGAYRPLCQSAVVVPPPASFRRSRPAFGRL